MVAPNRARYLAPIALAATLVATYVTVHEGLTTSRSTAHSHTARDKRVSHGRLTGAAFYTVQAGDNLTSIAAKTGSSIATLEALNPAVDPNSLQAGQRLRLRR